MATDEIRTPIFVGVGLPAINNKDIQYARYLTRDVNEDGTPMLHPWIRRFYSQNRDGQKVLHSWLFDVWCCIFDTSKWLTHRLRQNAISKGIIEE